MGIKKSVRFEVFKRDKFTCQYCGAQAPDAILHVDHIHPVSEGGTDDPLNLVTACRDCNLGKGAKLLADDTATKKRKKMLDELQDRREQLEMLFEWQRSLIDLESEEVEQLKKIWHDLVPGYVINEHGTRQIRQWRKKFSTVEIIEAIRSAVEGYLRYDKNDEGHLFVNPESVQKAFTYIPRIAITNRRAKENPVLRDIYFARGILRKRLSYINEWKSVKLMQAAVDVGVNPDDLKVIAKSVRNWTEFCKRLEEMIAEKERGDG